MSERPKAASPASAPKKDRKTGKTAAGPQKGEKAAGKHKVQLMMTAEDLAAIDEWQFENRVPTRARAIRLLVKKGLEED